MPRGPIAALAAGALALGVLLACRPLGRLSPIEGPTGALPPDRAPPSEERQEPDAPPGRPRAPSLAPPQLWLPNPGRPASPGVAPPTPEPGSVQTALDLAYGPDGRQRLDLYRPASAEPAPMLLFVHGGGWSSGDKRQYAWLGVQLAREGLLVAMTNYRLAPAVQHPQHAQDVAAATAWLYRHGAEYGGDPRRLYLAGHSAGAHLGALVALDARYLAAEGLSEPVIAGVAGFAGAATPLAPLRYVKPDAPPFLLVHGLLDTQAPAASAQAFAAALQQQGVRTALYLLPQLDHFTVL